jgi:quercetin dioxygenase-like cupin family protein
MNGAWPAVVLTLGLALGWAEPASAQVKPEAPAGAVRYEVVAEGVHEAKLVATEALAGVRVEVNDVILGPGKSAPASAFNGFRVTELKSGEVETTIDGQTARRRPGEFWVVGPGQSYAIKNAASMAVLHVVTLVRK